MPIVRPAASADAVALADLFEEMQAHYRAWCPPRETILASFARLPAGVEILVAEEGGAVVGFASFATIFPGPGIRHGLFLKELYVSTPHRGGGAGRALMQALAKIAVERGCGRLDWTADGGNARLMAFYEGLGGTAQTEKVFFRLSGEALDLLADGEGREA